MLFKTQNQRKDTKNPLKISCKEKTFIAEMMQSNAIQSGGPAPQSQEYPMDTFMVVFLG